MKSFTFWTLFLFSQQTIALPQIHPDTPIPLNAFKLRGRDGVDPHMGIDPELIRQYASQAPPAIQKRVTEFDPKEQLVDGETLPRRVETKITAPLTHRSPR